jgi:hypothetical protein
MARTLLIVSRTEPGRYSYVRHVFASETVDVILDRRRGDRRHDPRPVAVEKRQADRRVRVPTPDLEKFGWTAVNF